MTAISIPALRHSKQPNEMAQPTQEGLIRGIRRWDLVAVAINAIIGAGIFGLPSPVFALSVRTA